MRLRRSLTHHSFGIDPCQMREGQIHAHTIEEMSGRPLGSIIVDHSLQRKGTGGEISN
jgi:hypothetical protein